MNQTLLTSGPVPEPVTLEGTKVRVEPFEPELHAAGLYAASHGEQAEALFRYLPSGPFRDAERYREEMIGWNARPDTLMFTLVEPESGHPIGTASYMRIAPEHRCIEVGYIWFAPAAQRSVAATEAMYLMARHVFETLGYRRYEWKCDTLNEKSRRAALRLGFVFEGIFRQHMIVKGRNRDTAWFSMLDGEWPALKAGFERWLDHRNFSPDGRQVRSLAECRADGAGG
jgi:RimJ/RimL family protein N-acetyltransferase